eukprot:XP_011660555.1 PREDICTED: uncharacterized protein LOC105436586 [Strongylocentrotus purpuratus]
MDERLQIFIYLTFIVSKTYEMSVYTGIQNPEIIPVVALPGLISIADNRSEKEYKNGTSVSITYGRTLNLTCSVQDAIPPAQVEWDVSEEVQVRLEDQYNVVHDDAYTSRRVVSVTPSRDDDGKIVRCVASHRNLDERLQLFIRLIVQGDNLTNDIIPWIARLPPSDLRFTATETRSVIVVENSATSFTCKSIGSRPTALISWTIGSDDDLGSTTSTSTPNEADQGLRDTESTLQLIPKRGHHNQLLRCVAYAGMNQRQTEVRVIVYAGEPRDITCTVRGARPPALIEWRTDAEHIQVMDQVDVVQELQLSSSSNITNLTETLSLVVFQDIPVVITCKCVGSRPVAILFWELGDSVVTDGVTSSATRNSMDESLFDAENTPQMLATGNLQAGMSAAVTCIANNGYPAPVFQWNLGTTDLTNDSATEKELNGYNRIFARSVLTFTPKKSDHGQYLVCEVSMSEPESAWSRSVRKTIEISYPPVVVGLWARRSVAGDGRMYARFTCQVDARPQARIFEWFFNGSRLENDTKIVVHQWDFQETETVTTSTLMISNPKVINKGKYECLATTTLGNDSAVIYFNFSNKDELRAGP